MPFSELLILVGTTTGNAEYTAQAIELDCADLVPGIQVLRMDAQGPDVFGTPQDMARRLVLICCSTYGSGDVPDNAQAFYARLDEEPRDLSSLRYGVIALGDASYVNTFAGGGKRFDERLSGLGATRLGEIFIHDATSGDAPEETGLAWARQWLQEVQNA